jgi:site-specific DNA recombinase
VETKRAVLYARVSTEEQSKGYSLQTQLERREDYAAQRGYLIIEKIEDMQSGEQLEQVGLNRLFRLCREDDSECGHRL